MGQVYAEFQGYVRAQKEIGVMLTVNSKNEYENAVAGLEHPEGILKPDDFILIKANWGPKSKNIAEIADEMNILPDSLVFVDDNPAEREIVAAQVSGVAVPAIGTPEQYIRMLDHAGFFEVTDLSEDDQKRNEMYKANMERQRQQRSFGDYREYLLSLEMKGTIRAFDPVYMARIAQLTNKSNQFNLTTRRYAQGDIERFAADDSYITRYGKLEDKFGDNGVVSVVIGRKGFQSETEVYQRGGTISEDMEWKDREGPDIKAEGQGADVPALHIELWLMSCRVLKRDMEYAMMDSMVAACRECGISTIMGYYYPTAKNAMVKDFYKMMGFTKVHEEEGSSSWRFDISDDYQNKNSVIAVDR